MLMLRSKMFCDYGLRVSPEKLLNTSNVKTQNRSSVMPSLIYCLTWLAHSTTDIVNLIQKTVNWYVLGRAQPAYDSFKERLRTLGVWTQFCNIHT